MLVSEDMQVAETADARKEPLAAEAAWELIREYKTVVIGKGQKYLEYSPTEKNREEILKHALGRSGTLRAPALKSKGNLIVGYNVDMYDVFVKS